MRRRVPSGEVSFSTGQEKKGHVKGHILCGSIFMNIKKIQDPTIKSAVEANAIEVNSRVVNMFGHDRIPKIPTVDQRIEAQTFCGKLMADINQMLRERPDMADQLALREIVEYTDQVLIPFINMVPKEQDERAKKRVIDSNAGLDHSEEPHPLLREQFNVLAGIKDGSVKTPVSLAVRHINRILHWIDEGKNNPGVDLKKSLESGRKQLDDIIRRSFVLDGEDMQRLIKIKKQVDEVVSEYILEMDARDKKAQAEEYEKVQQVLLSTAKSRPVKQRGGYTFKGVGGKKVK